MMTEDKFEMRPRLHTETPKVTPRVYLAGCALQGMLSRDASVTVYTDEAIDEISATSLNYADQILKIISDQENDNA